MTERRRQLGIASRAIPKAWEETIAKCLSKEPGKRPSSMREVAAMLGLLEHSVRKRQQLLKAGFPSAGGSAISNLLKNKKARVAAIAFVLALAMAAGALPALIYSARNNARTAALPTPRPSAPKEPPSSPPPPATPVVESQSNASPAILIPPPSSADDRQFLQEAVNDGHLEIATTPPGLHYEVFKGVIADLKAAKPDTQTPLVDGTTPASLPSLERGTFTVVCERDGWDDQVREVQVGSDTARVDVAFPSGTLEIKSVPSGAQVALDGDTIGVTPLTTEAAPGDHDITATLAGKHDQDETVSITEGKPTSLLLRFGTATHKHSKPHPKKAPTGWQNLGATLGKIFGSSQQTKNH